MRTFHATVALAGFLFLLPACASAPRDAAPGDRVDEGLQFITAEEIQQSGSQTAWEVLRRVGGLSMTETSRGEPMSMKLRGTRSLVLDETPLVVLDGIAIRDVRVLQTIRADIVQWIEILSAADGTAMHGPMAGGGAIVVHTKTGDSSG